MRPIATESVRRLQAADHEAYFVGGCVRDQLLGREPQDYDIATSAAPEEIESLFPRTVPVGRQFGVMMVIEIGRDVMRGKQNPFLPAAGDYLGRGVGGTR
jgi:poly(A) polymerase